MALKNDSSMVDKDIEEKKAKQFTDLVDAIS